MFPIVRCLKCITTRLQFTILMDGDATWGKMVYIWGAGHHSTMEPERNVTFGEENEHIKYFDKLKPHLLIKASPF